MLEFSSEPVVNVGNTDKPTFFPPELCMVLPNQRANQALCPVQAEKMNELRLQNASNLVKPAEDMVGHTMQALATKVRDMSVSVSMVMTHHAHLAN